MRDEELSSMMSYLLETPGKPIERRRLKLCQAKRKAHKNQSSFFVVLLDVDVCTSLQKYFNKSALALRMEKNKTDSQPLYFLLSWRLWLRPKALVRFSECPAFVYPAVNGQPT